MCYDPISHPLCISRNVVFWEHRSFVKLSHFHASLSTSFVLDLFLDDPHIPSIVAHDPLIDLFVQSPDIFGAFPGSLSNEYVEDEQVEDKLPNPKLGSLTPTPPENLAQDIPPHHSTWVRSILAYLLDYHCYIALATLHEPHTYREASTNPLWQITMKEELDALSKNHAWDLVTLPPGNLWLVVNESIRSRLILMGPLSTIKLALL